MKTTSSTKSMQFKTRLIDRSKKAPKNNSNNDRRKMKWKQDGDGIGWQTKEAKIDTQGGNADTDRTVCWCRKQEVKLRYFQGETGPPATKVWEFEWLLMNALALNWLEIHKGFKPSVRSKNGKSQKLSFKEKMHQKWILVLYHKQISRPNQYHINHEDNLDYGKNKDAKSKISGLRLSNNI